VIAVFILITAAIAEALNIHAIFGAFLVGVALYHVFVQKEEYRAREIIYQFAMSLFAPLYFVSIGLKVNFISHFDIQLVLLVILLGSIGTVGGATLGALISKVSWRESLAIGFGMNARGAMEIILASTALEYGLINQEMFVALVIMALVTSMLSGPLLQWILKVPRS
jgi:Kef-type K+ transport system membrane component KefB